MLCLTLKVLCLYIHNNIGVHTSVLGIKSETFGTQLTERIVCCQIIYLLQRYASKYKRKNTNKCAVHMFLTKSFLFY